MSRAQQTRSRGARQEPRQRAFPPKVQPGRFALHEVVHDLQIFAATELAEVLAEQDDVVSGLAKRPAGICFSMVSR